MKPNDQIYIDTVRDQIKAGVYDHLIEIRCVKLECNPKRENLVVLDIGANTGCVSNFFAPFSKRVVAIEPAPETFKMLVLNTDDMPNIECFNVALAPTDAFVPFYVNDINFTASSTVNTYGKQIMVEGLKLGTMLKRFNLDHVDVCKIDAEGAEGESLDYYAIDNAKDIIKTYYVETHNCPQTTWEHKLGTLVGNFARCGYTKMTIDGMAITATK